MERRLTVGLVLVALAAIAVGLALSGPAVGSGSGPGIDGPPQTTPSGFNNTLFRIHVFENGSTKWTVQHSTPLETEEEIDQFETYAQTFRTEETDIFRNFKTRANRLTAAGTNATGREMNASGFSRDARIDYLGPTQGVVELSFWWSNFTRAEGDRLVIDDVFAGGMYIGTGQRLVVARGPNLTFVASAVEPPPDSPSDQNLSEATTLTWFGERQFADQRPLVTFAPSGAGENGGSVTTATPTPTPGSAVGSGAGPVPIALLLVVVLAIAVGLGYHRGLFRRKDEGDETATEAAESEADRAETTGGESAAVPEEEFLSDEDRVVRLLEENGGRMKQVNIVENTDWSKSKVSMLLSDMEDEGTISKLRVGRENIVTLSGEEPDAFGSPFDDE